MRQSVESGPPPAYSTLRPDDHVAAEIIRLWDREAAETSSCGCGRKCKREQCTNFPYLWFGFQSETRQPETGLMSVFGKRRNRPVWRAVFQVWTRNVACLMQEGFSWTSENLHIGHDKIILNDACRCSTLLPGEDGDIQIQVMLSQLFATSWGKTAKDTRWPHVRMFVLSRTLANDNPRQSWAGNLLVFSDDPKVLIDFDVKSITTGSTAWGWAVNPRGETVFDTRRGPNESFNTVFTGLLQWWSCPGDSPMQHTEKESDRRLRPDQEHNA